MTYFPEITNLTRPYQLFGFANTLTNGIFGIVILVMIFIIAFITMAGRNRHSASFAGASFITLIIALLLRAMSAVNDFVLIIAIVFTILGLVFVSFENK